MITDFKLQEDTDIGETPATPVEPTPEEPEGEEPSDIWLGWGARGKEFCSFSYEEIQ